MANVIASLAVQLTAESAKLRSGLDKARKDTKKWADRTRKQVDIAAKSFAGVGTAAVAAGAAIYAANAQAIGSLGKVADKVDVAAQALGGLRHAAVAAGGAADDMDSALQEMQLRLAEAATGGGEAVEAIQALGLDARKLASLAPDVAIGKIADALGGVKNRADQIFLVDSLMGEDGVRLLNALDLGSEGLRAMTAEAVALGVAVNRVDVEKVAAANKSMLRAGQVLSGWGKTITVGMAPFVGALSKAFVDWARDSVDFGQISSKAIGWAIEGVGYLSNVLHGVHLSWKALQVAFQAGALFIVKAIERPLNAPIEMMNAMIRKANSLVKELEEATGGFIKLRRPLEEFKPVQFLKDAVGVQARALDQAIVDLQTKLLEPLPREGVVAYLKEIQAQAKRAAEEIAKTKPGGAAHGGRQGSTLEIPELGGAGGAEVNQVGVDLQQLRDSLRTQTQVINDEYAQRVLTVEAAFNEEQLKLGERYALLEQLEREHQKRLQKIQDEAKTREHKQWQSGWQGKVSIASGMLGDLSSLMQSENAKQAKIGKKAAILQAKIDTVAGAQKAFTSLAGIPIVGPALGAAAAAAAIVAGKARVDAIKRGKIASPTSGAIQGSGNAPGAPAEPPLPAGQQAAAGRELVVTVNGVLTQQVIDDVLVPHLQDALDRDVIILGA